MVAAVADVAQVVSIQSVSSNGCINLVKAARDQIGLSKGAPVFLLLNAEVCLSADDGGVQGARSLDVGYRGRIQLPKDVLERLVVADGDLVGIVQRETGVALKRLALEIVPGDRGRLFDLETTESITRKIEQAPLPEDLLPRLQRASDGLMLRYDVLDFLKGRETLHAWLTRLALGRPDRDDDGLRERLISDRLATQAADGSWEADVVRTARMLRELSDLGLTRETSEVKRAVTWLMARPTSDHNPGQWFGADELVEEQSEVVARRLAQKRGTRPRFRALKAAEKRRVMAGDDLIRAPCGPRIMWPNGLTLESLLRLGYEDHPRVQEVLRLMRVQDWCECAYQHGLSGWRRSEPMTEDEVQAFEARCISQYRHAGLADPQALLQRDMAHRPFRQRRLEGTSTPGGTVYPLQVEDHIQGCEFITTRALATVTDPVMRRFASAHLWRFASRQLEDGRFPAERYGTGFGQAGILGAFARYDHPIAQVVIMRALPWIVEAQHQSGAWSRETESGKNGEARADAATRAVVRALLRVQVWLPDGFWDAATETYG